MSALRHYQSGALAAKDFLCRTHIDARAGRPFVAMRLRSKIDGITHALPREFRAGFIDAIYLFIAAALQGKAPDLLQWDVLAEVERTS
ncbi:hypothetical protein ACTHR6_18265 [Ralstonia holmesii]|uniref:hypothetical protein n=1 Tax=Ralstonia TaxID=48736 RepID=UPI0004694565|nr:MULTISPECIES: hypothetical protein [Ralstonia]CAJ0701063.1 hypothetical protein R11007_03454 [Ralstonia sp. LMG 32967]